MPVCEQPLVQRVLIMGLGLMGGSLALGLKRAGFAAEVRAHGHRESSLALGVANGVIDGYELDLDTALKDVDIVVIATPTLIAEQQLLTLLKKLPKENAPVITDVASVKGNLARAAQSACGDMPANLVLGHPIAGSEQSGVAAAKADLFNRHRVILTPFNTTDAKALALVTAMWQCCGAEVLQMSVEQHDVVLAGTSHLPHMLAYTLVDMLAASTAVTDVFRFAAGGFRDFTRIASSDPVMWRDIAVANREALLEELDAFEGHLKRLRHAVDSADGAALIDIFARAKTARDAFAKELAERSQDSTE
ncbi:MAG: prephenate dehydrogenase [Gammaproteobacteria bacterium]|nr:MAG: prephenate dehydrogenase [Gammaproteobacteria bacterium]